MYEIPNSIRRMEIISADFAARALTGLLEVRSVEDAKDGNFDDWMEAEILKISILSAVRNKTLEPHSITVIRDDFNKRIYANDLLNNDVVIDAEVYSKDLWFWLDENNKHVSALNPLEELNTYQSQFISIREFIETVNIQHPEMSVCQIAEWMIKKFCYDNHLQTYRLEIAGKMGIPDNEYPYDDNPFLIRLIQPLVFYGNEVLNPHDNFSHLSELMYSYDDFDTFGFKRSAIQDLIGFNFFEENTNPNNDDSCKKTEPPLSTDTHHEKDIKYSSILEGQERQLALEIISALSSLIVSKTGKKYKFGTKINASALADAVIEELCTLREVEKPEDGSDVNQRYRKLISKAVKESNL